jgi:hypothetical protein
MTLNRWECDAPGCFAMALGVGTADRLAAVGWELKPASAGYVKGALFCPIHRTTPLEIGIPREQGERIWEEIEQIKHRLDIITFALNQSSAKDGGRTYPQR